MGEAEVLLKLADYFQTEEVTARCEAWICSSLRSISDSKGLEDLACTGFELAIKYRLTRATALLLPWALQRLSHGGRQGVIWYDAHRWGDGKFLSAACTSKQAQEGRKQPARLQPHSA